jgi:hypothetical protein
MEKRRWFKMATEIQSKYIADLAVLKTKEFKEVKELLLANSIVGDNAEIVKGAQSIAEITHALTDAQASTFINVLIATKEPARSRVYSKRRVEGTITILDDIKATIAGWKF